MKSDFRKTVTQKSTVPEKDLSRCAAYGCPCRASITLGGDQWLCAAHSLVVSDQWQRVTSKLRDNDWLIGFIGEIQKMDRNQDNWREFATQFWVNSDTFCTPVDGEAATLYQNRMRGELMFRVGAVVKRPVPKPVCGAQDFMQGAKNWAHRLKERHEVGDSLSQYQITSYQAALGKVAEHA
jgi:hypothetical protein